MKEYMLSTSDNPYDYFNNFREWFVYDVTNGHNCCGLLARLVAISDDCSPYDNNERISEAIDFIIEHDLENKFIKIEREVEMSDYFGEC